MPKATSKKASRRKKTSASRKNPNSKKMVLFILALVGVILLIEAVSFFEGQVNASKDLPVQSVMEIGGDSLPSGPFKAWDVLVTPDNRIALSDQTQNRILILDSQGKFLTQFGQKQAGDPPFKEVSCLAADASGDVYVIDPWTGTIRGFDPKGRLMAKISLDGKGFYGPRGIAWDKGSFLIADTGSHRLVKLSSSGNVDAAWGQRGSGKGNFDNPTQVAVDAQNNYYVVDQQNNRIQVLDSEGHFVREISLGAQPSAEAVDAKKKWIYVSSTDGKFVRAYTLEGKLMGNLVDGDKKQPVQNVNSLSVLGDGDLLAAKLDRLVVYHFLPVTAGKP